MSLSIKPVIYGLHEFLPANCTFLILVCSKCHVFSMMSANSIYLCKALFCKGLPTISCSTIDPLTTASAGAWHDNLLQYNYLKFHQTIMKIQEDAGLSCLGSMCLLLPMISISDTWSSQHFPSPNPPKKRKVSVRWSWCLHMNTEVSRSSHDTLEDTHFSSSQATFHQKIQEYRNPSTKALLQCWQLFSIIVPLPHYKILAGKDLSQDGYASSEKGFLLMHTSGL